MAHLEYKFTDAKLIRAIGEYIQTVNWCYNIAVYKGETLINNKVHEIGWDFVRVDVNGLIWDDDHDNSLIDDGSCGKCYMRLSYNRYYICLFEHKKFIKFTIPDNCKDSDIIVVVNNKHVIFINVDLYIYIYSTESKTIKKIKTFCSSIFDLVCFNINHDSKLQVIEKYNIENSDINDYCENALYLNTDYALSKKPSGALIVSHNPIKHENIYTINNNKAQIASWNPRNWHLYPRDYIFRILCIYYYMPIPRDLIINEIVPRMQCRAKL